MARREQTTTDRERRSYMARCAALFYLRKPPLSQAQIADALGLTPSSVSRFLKQARESGMVKIQLDLPREETLQVELIRRYNLRNAVVVPCPFEGRRRKRAKRSSFLNEILGQTAASFLEESNSPLQNGMKVGISCGETLLQLVMALRRGKYRDLTITALTVEGVPELVHVAPSTLVGILMAKYQEGSEVYGVLAMPGTSSEKRAEKRQLFLEEFEETRRRVKELDVAVVGVGAVDITNEGLGFTKILRRCNVTGQELEEHGVVGEVNNRPFDRDGTDLYDRIRRLQEATHAIELDLLTQLARKKPVIAVAGGDNKIEAIRVALKSRFVNILVTDSLTASHLL